MRKFAKLVLPLFALLALGYYGYTRYQNSSSLKGVVHQDATSVIKIGIHDIKKTLILDALGAPRYYYQNLDLGNRTGDDDGKKESIGKGVEFMPYNLLFFTMPKVEHTVFTVFKIYDFTEFEAYVHNKVTPKLDANGITATQGYQSGVFKNGSIAIAWNDEKLALAVAPRIKNSGIADVFKELLVDDKTIPSTDHPLLKTIKNETAHAVYAADGGVATLTFNDGNAFLKGKGSVDFPFAKEVTFPSYRNTSLSFHYGLNLRANPIREALLARRLGNLTFFEKYNLDASEIAKSLDGRLSFAISGRTVQNDTIITYEYDDNFEKVARKTVQKRNVPAAYLHLGVQGQKLKSYLSEKGALSENGIFEPFPLYQTTLFEQSTGAVFSTVNDTILPKGKTSSYFFNLQADFEKLQKDLDISHTRELFSILTNMRIQAWHVDEREIKLEGTLNAVDDDINILSQLFFGLRNNKIIEPKEAEL
ncbi:hypothetical protein MTsPCn5_33480 [Croceitalea sp. MTPC5]|uniref:hypothetical protein n=1 Tax=Croceitalea sp. MTPC5 TaxID=3056565 RepID=UPI002B3715A5|nr:hypothetical protein MTsPCn5_33480 [Croceitalea sp. MTPC5]